ncbi:MAG TPA: hypothetical protein PK250_10970 [Syntrophobacter fumaroxidans]|mgnify:CR=1 FL=1|nr:hypothetical protein [Syntrophobacter fumaroxidans]
MLEDPVEQLAEWKRELEGAWRAIPKPFRNDHSVRRTLQCHLFARLCGAEVRVVADYLPPRVQDRAVDLIVVREDLEIAWAICFDTLVALAAVKSLGSFAARNKVIFTTGMIEKKVQESRFFLNAEIQHVHLRPFDHFA